MICYWIQNQFKYSGFGIKEFKVVLFDKEGRIIVESAVNKVKWKVQSSGQGIYHRWKQ